MLQFICACDFISQMFSFGEHFPLLSSCSKQFFLVFYIFMGLKWLIHMLPFSLDLSAVVCSLPRFSSLFTLVSCFFFLLKTEYVMSFDFRSFVGKDFSINIPHKQFFLSSASGWEAESSTNVEKQGILPFKKRRIKAVFAVDVCFRKHSRFL